MRTSYLALAAAVIASPGLAQSIPHLQQAPAGRQVQPNRAASYTVIDGRIVLTSAWMPLNNAPPRDGNYYQAAFDAAEHDATGGVLGFPTDNSPGCTDLIPVGSRWFFGLAYNNPFVSADLQTAPAGRGARCKGMTISWYFELGNAEPDHDGDGFPDAAYYMAVRTFESTRVADCTDDGTDALSGVILNFQDPPPGDPHFFNFAIIDLHYLGLSLQMPFDGVGGYQVIIAIAFDPETGILTVPTGIDPVTQRGATTQMMLWGTGDHEPVNDGRAGTEVDGQFDDDNPTDGVHDFATECNSYLYGVCPDPLAPSVGFWIKSPAPCPCDINNDGITEISDLALLLASFGTAAPNIPVPGADINGDGIVSITDLALILACFGTSC